MVKAKKSDNFIADFWDKYKGKLQFPRQIWIRLLLVTLSLLLSAALVSAVSLWSDTFVAAGFYADVCNADTSKPTPPGGYYTYNSCLKQYVGVVTSVIGGNVYGVQCSTFFAGFFTQHGGRFTVAAAGTCLLIGWITITALQQAVSNPDTQFLAHNWLQVASMLQAVGVNLLSESTYTFMTPTKGLQGLLLIMSCAGVGAGAVGTFAVKLMAYQAGAGAQGMIQLQAVLVVIAVVMCYFSVPTEAELQTYENHPKPVVDIDDGPGEKQSRFRGMADICRASGRMIFKNWFRHAFFLFNMANNTATASMYQGLATKYGTLLFGSYSGGVILACVSSGAGMIVTSGLAPAVSLVIDKIGLKKIYIIMTFLLWISRLLVCVRSWFAQVYVAVTFALVWGLQPVIWGSYAYAYALLNRVQSVILMFSVMYIFFFETAQSQSVSEFLHPSNDDFTDLQSLQLILRAGLRNCLMTSTLYTVYFCLIGIPSYPVVFSEEESAFCKLFACSKIHDVLPILKAKDDRACYGMLSTASVPENRPRLVTRINEGCLRDALQKQNATQLADILADKSMAWQQSMKAGGYKMGNVGLIAPASQWGDMMGELDMDKLGENAAKALKNLQKELASGSSTLIQDANDPTKFIRYVDVVLLRIRFQPEPGKRKKDWMLVETGRTGHSGEFMETFRFPGTKKQPTETLNESAERYLQWLGVEDKTILADFSEVLLESHESPKYPGLTNVYKKHLGDITIPHGCAQLQKIGLPDGKEWVHGKDGDHFNWMTYLEIYEKKPDFAGGEKPEKTENGKPVRTSSHGGRRSSQRNKDDGIARLSGLSNISLKDLDPQERSLRLKARQHTNNLTRIIRKREKADLIELFEDAEPEDLSEGFRAMNVWIDRDTFARYHKKFLELISWDELAVTLRNRKELRPMMIEIVLNDLTAAKLALRGKMEG